MKKPLIALAVILIATFNCVILSHASYPEKPIHVVVYTPPGGAADLTARLVSKIAEKNYLKVPIVVENKPGAGGVVALSYVLNQPADGYTVFAMTSAVISSVIKAKQSEKLEQLHYLARLVEDYECLIVNKETDVSSFDDIIKDAKAKNGNQVWMGPSVGSTDHMFAVKVLEVTGLKVKYVPYTGGGEAMAALMGGHGAVGLGNPQDTSGRPSLAVAAVTSTQRLKNFPDTPTFRELGYDQLTGEVIWRGLAIRKGTDPSVIRFLEELFEKAGKDQEWIQFNERNNTNPVYNTGGDFAAIVEKHVKETTKYMKDTGLMK